MKLLFALLSVASVFTGQAFAEGPAQLDLTQVPNCQDSQTIRVPIEAQGEFQLPSGEWVRVSENGLTSVPADNLKINLQKDHFCLKQTLELGDNGSFELTATLAGKSGFLYLKCGDDCFVPGVGFELSSVSFTLSSDSANAYRFKEKSRDIDGVFWVIPVVHSKQSMDTNVEKVTGTKKLD